MLVHERGAAQQPEGQPSVWAGGSRAVTVAALTLLAIQLIWMIALLTHNYFRQDDFFYQYRAVTSGFSWHYLMWEDSGQLQPLGMAFFWGLASVSLYNWPLACFLILGLLAATSLALLHMLRTLFGNTPAILIPFAVFVFSPFELGAVSWLSVTVDLLPLELSLCMAVAAHIRYLRNGRMRNALVAAAWLLAGMAATDKGAVVPLLLFGLTSAFFAEGPWAASAVKTARRHWRVWLLYGSVVTVWGAVYLSQLSSSWVKPHNPGSASNVLDFVATMIGTVLVPGAIGGPWRWAASGFSSVDPPAALQQLSWAVFAIVVIVSCARRVRAWRAWVILAGWIVAADIVPVVLGRLGAAVPGSLIAMQARYLADTAPVLALCIGLAFLPLAEEQGSIRLQLPAARPATYFVLGAYFIGSFWSLQSFESQNSAAATAARSYIATARAAVAGAPPGALIVDRTTPDVIVSHWVSWPSGYGFTSQVIGAIAHGEPAKHLSWSVSPRGVHSNLMIFNTQGQLLPAVVAGPLSGPPPVNTPGKKTSAKKTSGPRCWAVTTAGTSIPVQGSLYRWVWFVRLDYSGPATAAAVTYGGRNYHAAWAAVELPAGTHSFYVPVVGGGSAVTVRLASPAPGWCLSGLAVGSLQPASGPAIPTAPVDG